MLAASAFWFTVVKTLGGLYLLFLAVKLLRAGVAARLDTPQAGAASRWRLFANTYLVTALNPKGIIFFVAFLPQFIQPARALLPQYLVLGLTFVALAALNATMYAVFAGQARRALTSPAAQKRFNLAGGSLLAGAGIWALVARQP